MMGRPFIKMHGLGNDFVVIDARREPFALDDARARRIADRHLGVGCDQILVMEPPSNGSAEAFKRNKMRAGIATACAKRPVSPAEIEALVDRVEDALTGSARVEIPSSSIGEAVASSSSTYQGCGSGNGSTIPSI